MRTRTRAVQSSHTPLYMQIVQRALLAAALAVGALLLLPSEGQAQLGKLKKLGGDIVKEASREAVGLPPRTADATASNGSKAKVDYTVTPERLDAVMLALAPLVEDARREAAAVAVEKSFRAKRTAWEKCVELAGKNATGLSEAYLNAGEKETGKAAEAMGRLATAMQRGEKRMVAYLQDTVGVYTMETTALMVGAKCGAAMYTPSALIEAQLARDAGGSGEVDENGRVSREFTVPASARKGLTAQQFGVLRERVAIYAIALAKGDASEASLANFTDAEHTALKSRASDLRTMAPFFRDGHMRWATWGDVKAW